MHSFIVHTIIALKRLPAFSVSGLTREAYVCAHGHIESMHEDGLVPVLVNSTKQRALLLV